METKRCKMKEGCLGESKTQRLKGWRAAELTDREQNRGEEHDGEEETNAR